MLSQKKRVQRPLFPRVVKAGKTYSSPYLSIRVLFAPEVATPSKHSFVVSKKVAKSAPKRNLLKKRGYSVIKNLGNKIPEGFVLIYYVKKDVIKLSYKEFEKEIHELLKKAQVLK